MNEKGSNGFTKSNGTNGHHAANEFKSNGIISTGEDESEVIRLFNCSLLRNGVFVNEDLWIRNGKIISPQEVFYDEKTFPNKEIDCAGRVVAPGFIDLQINGKYIRYN